MESDTVDDRWQLPDGVNEVLPPAAADLEQLRRQLLDLFNSWGYDYVVPPLLEYLDSLLIGFGSDLDLQTFKVTDQLNGRMMGIRADLTSQAARMDAHSLSHQGVSRLCYCGTALHARPEGVLASRCPMVTGAELFGDASPEADAEMLALMAETLVLAGVEGAKLELGHLGIFASLTAAAELPSEAVADLYSALQRKSVPDIALTLDRQGVTGELATAIRALPRLLGGAEVLTEARQVLARAPKGVAQALAELERIAELATPALAGLELRFDLCEFRGYRYHTGAVFAGYAPGAGHALTKGGRYDAMGAAFGRARPATGFDTDLLQLLAQRAPEPAPGCVQAPGLAAADPALLQAVRDLRAAGRRVVMVNADSGPVAGCREQLVRTAGAWTVQPLPVDGTVAANIN